ncbi:MAG: hypothetical protein ACLUSV_03285 [Streptococcus sp.]
MQSKPMVCVYDLLSQALQILDLFSFGLPLVLTVIKSIIPLVASYFVDHYLHDMNQATSLILIGTMGFISFRPSPVFENLLC